MIRAVIDTNVLVSGLLSPVGNEALVILAVHRGLLQPCVSVEVIQEYAEVLARPKFAFPRDEVSAVIAMFRDNGELVAPQGLAPAPPDPDDAKFRHCPQATEAEYLVTGNKRHFPQALAAVCAWSAPANFLTASPSRSEAYYCICIPRP